MPRKKIDIFMPLVLLLIIFLNGCMKQEAPQIENSYSETIETSRLAACTRMNLFTDLLEHENLKSVFDCTNWSKKFPQIRKNIQIFTPENWNNLVLPVSTKALNDRSLLKRAIAVTQDLDSKGGLDDLGMVITALSDTNFYDGMNELMSCANGELCARDKAPVKKDIVNAFGVLDLIRDNTEALHILFTSAVKSFEVLSSDFSKRVTKVLKSPSFVSKRVEMLDLLVKFVTMPRTKVTQNFLPSIFDDDQNSIFNWVNSSDFHVGLIKSVLAYDLSHPLAVKDFRSIAKIRAMKLRCASDIGAGFFINLDQHIYTLVSKIGSKDLEELESYLADDLAMHQVALQGCPNFSNIKVELDGQEHIVNLVRMKKSLIDLIRIPGVHSVAKIISNKLISASSGSAKDLGDFVALQIEDDYLGSFLSFLKILDKESPELFEEYVNYIKSFAEVNYSETSKVLKHLVSEKQDSVWPAIRKIWFFFNTNEKNFIFNYIDRHFVDETNYKTLFSYYLNIFTTLKPSIPGLISSWRDNGMDVKNFNGLRELSLRFHGEEVLSEFKDFFSRTHILKVIELFINGEQLSSWAREVRNALPIVELNQATFSINSNGNNVSGDQCLNAIAAHDLTILVKDFPKECTLFNNQVLLEKIFLLSQFSDEFEEDFGHNPFTATGLLSPSVISNAMVSLKKAWMKLDTLGVEHLTFVKHLQNKFSHKFIKELLNSFNLFLEQSPEREADLFKENVLIEVSSTLSDKESLKTISQALNEYSIWRKAGGVQRARNRVYPGFEASRSCEKELNLKVGGSVCPSRKDFLDFVKIFSHLLARKNDDSPIAARQFLLALDPAAGFAIPYKAKEQELKNLSIQESLDMFWELSDRSRTVNNVDMEYEGDDGVVRKENLTTMERIEVVIRDVNFDENYLGAHYKNSVTKSFDYLKVVDSKYSLFKVCVGAKFCGKFMNRKEKRMARNAVEAFPSLLDVNRNGLMFGDYMKALLGTVVSSSSKASQISTLVRFKKNGDGFNIPWIQTKKQLRKHNGVILSELSRIGAFSNMARWTRDRFGRKEEDFKNFINSQELRLISNNLLKGFSSSVTDESLIALFNAIENNSAIATDLWDWLASLNYAQLRRVEDIAGNILSIFASVEKSNADRNWNKAIELATWTVENYEVLKRHWPQRKLFNLLEMLQPATEFIAQNIHDENATIVNLVNILYTQAEKLVLESQQRTSFLNLVDTSFNAIQAKAIGQMIEGLISLLEDDLNDDNEIAAAGAAAMSSALSSDSGGMLGVASYLKQSANKRACRYEGELVVCSDNQHYLEPWKMIKFVTASDQRYDKYVTGLFANPENLTSWMSDSMALLYLETSLGD